ncbi:MAG: hypothetical protein P4L46_02275 [Fimbriimonas sp.]|nr:hypothetical protein [Fimbriimonas sp.]
MRKLLLLAGVLAALAVGGCGHDDSAPSAKTQEQSSRLNEIQQKTGSDWSKLSDADKNYLINDLAHGSEQTARMLLGPPARPARPGGK